MDAAALIALVGEEEFTLKRPDGPNVNIDGHLQSAARTPTTIKGSVQPATGHQLMSVPEAQRTREGIAVYTASELRTGDQENGVAPDVIVYGGIDYLVSKVSPYPVGDLAHYEVIATRIEEQ